MQSRRPRLVGRMGPNYPHLRIKMPPLPVPIGIYVLCIIPQTSGAAAAGCLGRPRMRGGGEE